MKPEIKQRIDQIRAGEIPKGYKRTRAGIVPQNWEIKKMSSVLKKQTQKNRNNAIQNVLTNSATQGIVCQIDYFDKQIANNENTNEYYVVKPGYFVYNPRISVTAPCGPFNRYNGNEDGIMSPLYSIYCFCDKSKTYSDFLTYYFSSSKWYAYMNSIANYGARSDRMNVTKEDMDNMPIPYPPLYEQQRIVAILSTQDRIIELCERKTEQLKRMKKYYLQKMFPKDGEEYPEIRFKGFTDAWEKRKFGEVFVEYSEKGHEELPPLTIIQGKGTILRKELQRILIYNASGLKNYKLVDEDDFILHLRSFEGGLEKANSRGIVSPAYHIFHGENTDTRFYYPFFRSKYFISVLLKPHVYGIRDGKSIDIEGLKSIDIPYLSIEEQNKIGGFFSKLDQLITLHQRKYEEEKKKKKALQQLLLTGIVRVKE